MAKKSKSKEKPASVAKAAILFGSGTLTSRILGLIRDALFFALLPIDAKDAWLAAWRLPNFFRRLLGEGGLSVSFIPVFVEARADHSPYRVRGLVNGVFTLLTSLAGLICLICIVFMEPIIEWWLQGDGFTKVPGKIAMTVSMARVMVSFLFCMSIFAYLMALLNGMKKFTLTGFAPVLLNMSIIVGLLIFRDSANIGMAAAWAVVIGGALQAGILIPAVAKLHLLPKFNFSAVRSSLVTKVLQKFAPTFLGVGVLQVLGLINVAFASQLQKGAVSYIYLGDRLLELPLSLIAVSIGTALLPTLSDYWAKNEKSLFLACLTQHLQLFLFLAIPAMVGLWFIGSDIVQVLFVRKEFRMEEVAVVAGILQVYCLTLFSAGTLRITNQSYYSRQDTLTPALIAIGGLIIHVIMAPYWMKLWGVKGLCFSTALTTTLNLSVSLVILTRQVGAMEFKKLFVHLGKCCAAGVGLGLYLYGLSYLPWKQGRFFLDFPILIILIGIGGVIYFALSHYLKISEMQQVVKRFRKNPIS